MTSATIGEAEQRQFRDDGFVVLRGLFESASVRAAADEIDTLTARDELTARSNLRARRSFNLQQMTEVLESFDPIVDVAPSCRALAGDPRLLGIVAALRGTDEVALFKDKLILKPAGTVGYPLHQDFIAWKRFPESFTTVVVALEPATEETGAIEVFRGAHAKGCLAPRDGGFHILDDALIAGHERVALALSPGDVAIYGAFMPHRSGINQTSASRKHLLASYADGADPNGARRADHYDEFHQWLREVYGGMGLGDLHFR